LVHKLRHLFGLAIVGAVVGVAVTAHQGAAQRTSRTQNLKQVLITPPIPENDRDSAFAVEFADEFRRRIAGKIRNQMRVVETDKYCEALEASGFPCGTLLDDNSSEQLARFVSADAYVVGRLTSNSAPNVAIRIVDIGRSGLAGMVSVVGTPGVEAKDLAEIAADSIREQVRAAREVQQCNERRERSDFGGARERAERAFEMYPNHPAAALCVSYLFEVTKQPADSLIWAYDKCTRGDPRNDTCWDRLGRYYYERGDTLGAIQSFEGKLRAQPRNTDLRKQVAGMYEEIGEVDKALSIYEGGMVGSSADEFLQLKIRACVKAERWPCALNAYNARYDRADSLASDTTFLQGVIGAADLAGDTAESVKWTGIAARSFPDRIAYLTNHGIWLKNAGLTDSAMTVNRRITEMDPTNTAAPLTIAQILLEGLKVDSTIPLDTARMHTIDSILTAVGSMTRDSTVLGAVGLLYLQPAMRIAQLQAFAPRVASDWLVKGLGYPVNERIKPQANFFLGLATIFFITDVANETNEAKTCQAVDVFTQTVLRGKNAMMAGRSISPQAADQLLNQQYAYFETLIPRFREAFCTDSR